MISCHKCNLKIHCKHYLGNPSEKELDGCILYEE